MKFTRIAGCTATGETVYITHDYGNLAISWKEISGISALEIKNGEGEEIPFLFLSIANQEGYFYIDGQKISPRLFLFDRASADMAKLERARQNQEPRRFIEKKFQWLAREFCTRLEPPQIDPPLLESLAGSTLIMTPFPSFREASQYCLQMEARKAEREALIHEPEKREAIRDPHQEREEWKAGDLIEGIYTVQEVIRGGMGIVYIVFDAELVTLYAVKTFQEQFIWNEKVVEQFLKEAEIWISLQRHPHIVNAEFVKIIDGKPYLFLEYVRGSSLEHLMERALPTVIESLNYAIQFCSGMEYAFDAIGLIHRDIKPSNCMMTGEGTIKITDFGLGKVFKRIPQDQVHLNVLKSGDRDASTAMAGTLAFMAPEIFSNSNAASVRSDIYSFGTMLYMMLTGINPFYSEDPIEVISRHLNLIPDPPGSLNPEISPSLGSLILTCLDKDPGGRFQSFTAVRENLQEIYRATAGEVYRDFCSPVQQIGDDDWITRGISLARLGRHKEALVMYGQALAVNPHSRRALTEKGIALAACGLIDEALSCFDQILLHDPEHSGALYNKGLIAWKKGDGEEALSLFDSALLSFPENAEFLLSKGKVLMEMKREAEALECCERVLEGNGQMEQAHLQKGEILHRRGEDRQALDSLNRALEITPRYYDAWHLRGRILFSLGHVTEALEAFNRALSIKPDSFTDLIAASECHLENRNIDKALAFIDRALSLEPRNRQASLLRAALLEEEGHYQEALATLRKAFPSSDRESDILCPMLTLSLRLGFFDRAAELARQQEGDRKEENAPLADSALFWQHEQEAFEEQMAEYPRKTFRSLDDVLCHFCSINDSLMHSASMAEADRDGPQELMAAELLFIAGKADEARRALERARMKGEQCAQIESLFEDQQKRAGRQKGFLNGLLRREKTRSAEEWLIEGLWHFHRDDFMESLAAFQEALRLDSGLISCWFFAAMSLFRQGDHDKAEQCLAAFIEKAAHSPGYCRYRVLAGKGDEYCHQQWIRCDPHDPGAWTAYLSMLVAEGHIEKARLAASHMIRKHLVLSRMSRKSPLYWNLRGILEFLMERKGRALKCFNRSLALDPFDSFASSAKARLLRQTGNYRVSLDILRAVETGSPLVSLYEQAGLFMEKDREEEALQSIEKALMKAPRSALLNFRKAEIHLAFENYRAFFAHSSVLLHLDGRFLPYSLLKGEALIHCGKIADALSYLYNLEPSFPGSTPVLESLGLLHLHQRSFDRAAGYFDRIRALSPLHAGALLCRGIIHYMEADYQKACDLFGQCLLLAPWDRNTTCWLGAAEYGAGRQHEAQLRFTRLIKSGTGYFRGWSNCAVVLFRQGDPEKALFHADKALRISRENGPTWLVRCACERAQGKLDEAGSSVRQALICEPASLYGWIQKGIIECAAGRLRTGLECFIRATEIDDRMAGLFYNRALAALRLGDMPETRQSIARARALKPSFQEIDLLEGAFLGQQGGNAADSLAFREEIPLPFDLPMPPLSFRKEPFTLPAMLQMDACLAP